MMISISNIISQKRCVELTAPFLFFVFFVLIWDVVIRVFNIPNYLVPSPYQILTYLLENYNIVLRHSAITMLEALSGFIIGTLFGIMIAIGFAHSKLFERVIYPYMVALKAIPIVALAPLLVLWFGSGIAGKIVMSSLICFFPVIVNTTTGLKSVSKESLDLFNSLAASRLDIFFKLRLPNSLPYIFSALRIASTLSVVGAIVAEFSGANAGLGYMMMVSVYQLNSEALYTGIFFSAISGILLFSLVVIVEKKILSWHDIN